MIPRRCPSTPLQEASLSFHLWPIHQNPRAFLQAKAINKKCNTFSKHHWDVEVLSNYHHQLCLQLRRLNISFYCSLDCLTLNDNWSKSHFPTGHNNFSVEAQPILLSSKLQISYSYLLSLDRVSLSKISILIYCCTTMEKRMDVRTKPPYLSHAPWLQSKGLKIIVHFIHTADLR